ncbi:hypothetical protein UlMin_023620 [Ulmus minor]
MIFRLLTVESSIGGAPKTKTLDMFNKLKLDLRNTGKKFDDEDVAVILLNSLPESFDDIKTAIKYGRDTLTSSIVINGIKSKDFETRIKKDKLSSTNGRFQSKPRYNNRNNYNRNGNGNNNNNCACYYCGKEGHWKRNCNKRIREEKEKGQEDGTAVVVTKEEDFADALAVSEKLESCNSKWFMDSQCTYHMCPRIDWFTHFQKIDGSSVFMGNNQTCKVEGIGNISI